jgi:hypothetical protein
MMFVNNVLRRIFVPKRAGEKSMPNKELVQSSQVFVY